MEDFAVATKAIILRKDGKLLLIKRSAKNTSKPFVWEIPGGRCDYAENPFNGIKREVKEETGLEIEVLNTINTHYFKRDDNQIVTMIVFLAKAGADQVKLSDEHLDYKWLEDKEAEDLVFERYKEDIKIYRKYFKEKVLP